MVQQNQTLEQITNLLTHYTFITLIDSLMSSVGVFCFDQYEEEMNTSGRQMQVTQVQTIHTLLNHLICFDLVQDSVGAFVFSFQRNNALSV